MTISNILLGSVTTDTINLYRGGELVGSFQEDGGLFNVLRNLKNKDVKIIPLGHKEVTIQIGLDTGSITTGITSEESYDYDFNEIPKAHWIHLAYLDWIWPQTPWINKNGESNIDILKTKADIVTCDSVDFVPLSVGNIEQFDLIFANSPAFIANDKYFVHSENEWIVRGQHYPAHPVDIEYTLGAGDTLVACVMNNVPDLGGLERSLTKIREELNQRLLKRDEWIQEQFC